MNINQKIFTNRYVRLSMCMLVSLVLNTALYAAKAGRVLQKRTKPVIERMESVEGQLPVTDVMNQVTRDRQELQALRSRYMQEYTQQGGMHGNCVQLAAKITQDTMAYVSQRIAEVIKKLGQAPTKFSLFTMGSMARDESGFFTDLEIGILVEKKDPAVLSYFKRFSQELADRFFKLGEAPEVGGKGLRFDEGDNAPDHLRWYARYASPEQLVELEKGDIGKGPYEGSRLFVATPEEFADLWNPDFLNYLAGLPTISTKEKELAQSISSATRNIRHLYGDNALLNKYLAAREKNLRGAMLYSNPNYVNRREEIAYFNLEYDVKKHGAPGSAIAMGKLGDTIAPKLTLYRFPEQVLTSLGFWYNVGVQNTAQIADKLVAMGRMSKQWADALKDLMNFAICLRLKKQIKLGKQIFDIPVTQKGYTDLKQRFATQLTTATKNLALATAAKDTNAIMQAEEDVLKARVSLQDLEKMAPGKPDPLLTPEIVAALNTKYLPMEKKLLEVTQKFITGDKNAFLGTDVGVLATNMPVTTKPTTTKSATKPVTTKPTTKPAKAPAKKK